MGFIRPFPRVKGQGPCSSFGAPSLFEQLAGQGGGAEIRGKMKLNSFTFISPSGAGNSLARGKSNRTVVMIRAPRKTKTMENLGAKKET